ncbi:MAG: ribbon-helix-helix domain-containing protein [Chitinophagales bacterium]|nr:ribbon-helix-helix domain-containing protein [Hyphomicrobiales bacterium]
MSRIEPTFELFANDANPSQRRLAADAGRPVKRSLTIAGHRTSISLEEAFWSALQDVARERGKAVASLIFQIDAKRGKTNLSSAIRVFLLEHFRGRESV